MAVSRLGVPASLPHNAPAFRRTHEIRQRARTQGQPHHCPQDGAGGRGGDTLPSSRGRAVASQRRKLLDQPGVRTALAVSLYKDDSLSFGHAARLAGMALADFMRHISPLGIPAIKGNAATLREDLTDLGAWLARPA